MNLNSLKIVSLRNSLISARFLLSVVILVIAVVVLQPGVKALSVKYEKKPIAIKKSLIAFDILQLNSFKYGFKLRNVPAQAEDIETTEYTHLSLTKRDIIRGPQHVEFFVTYYSNPRDKVPHTPDVCSRQAVAIVRELSSIELDVPSLAAKHSKIKCKLVLLDWDNFSTAVIYVFFAEGRFRSTREQVRWDIGMPGHSHTYFSKIEVTAYYRFKSDPTDAIQTCKNVLTEALPILLTEHFPSDEQITAR